MFHRILATVVVVAALGATAVARADLILLTNGYTIEAEILIETDDEIVLRAKNGTIVLARDEVKHVVRTAKPSATPEGETAPPPARTSNDPRPDAAPASDPKSDAPERDSAEAAAPRATTSESAPVGTRTTAGPARFMLPKSFTRASGSKLPSTVQGAVEVLGEWQESSTSTRISVVSLPVPHGLPPQQMSSVLFTQIEQRAVTDDRLTFRRGVIGSTPVLWGDHVSEEPPAGVANSTSKISWRVRSVYFVTKDAIQIFSVAVPLAEDAKRPKRYESIVRSLRIVEPK